MCARWLNLRPIFSGLIWFGCCGGLAWGDEPPRFFVGGGVLAHNLGQYSTQPSGMTSLVSSVFPELVLSAWLPVDEGPWSLSPFLALTPGIPFTGATVFAHTTADGGEKTQLLRLAVRAQRDLGLEPWSVGLFGGLGVLAWTIRGMGGTIELNNGNSKSIFGLPSETSTSRVFYGELGVGVQRWRFRWESSILMTGALSPRRAVSVTTQLSFGVF
ncbi:hypothetical protein WDW37_05180 [Bdellovibrionota bacterium FG-1]